MAQDSRVEVPPMGIGAVSSTQNVTQWVLIRVFHKLHFAKKKDAIPLRTPHGCI